MLVPTQYIEKDAVGAIDDTPWVECTLARRRASGAKKPFLARKDEGGEAARMRTLALVCGISLAGTVLLAMGTASSALRDFDYSAVSPDWQPQGPAFGI